MGRLQGLALATARCHKARRPPASTRKPNGRPHRGYAHSVPNASAIMTNTDARLWHPWLRINRVLRVRLHTGLVPRGGLRGRPPRHGFSESTLALEQGSLSFSDQDFGSVAGLVRLLDEVLRRLSDRLRPESYFRGQHRAAEEMCANGLG